jgi:hypothetical protein
LNVDNFRVGLPINVTDPKTKTTTTTYGSFALNNSWPRKTSEARSVFLDQFTGRNNGGSTLRHRLKIHPSHDDTGVFAGHVAGD